MAAWFTETENNNILGMNKNPKFLERLIDIWTSGMTKIIREKSKSIILGKKKEKYDQANKEFIDYINSLEEYNVHVYENIGDGIAVLTKK